MGSHRDGAQLNRLWAACLVVLLAGCAQVAYVGQAAVGQMRILLSRRPIDEFLRRRDLSPQIREGVRWVQRAAEGAERELKLRRDKHYREIADLPGGFNVWVLTLAQADRLEGVSWWFPIVGRVPYLGFFSRAAAEAMAARQPELDRHIRTAAAYSTLGYFPDPILPGFLDLPPDVIVNTVVHELVHSTIYLPGESEFNESVATVLGDAGAARLLQLWGERSLADAAADRRADRQDWARAIREVTDELRAAYAAEPESSARLAAKQRIVDEFRARIRSHPWRVSRYDRYAAGEINHAFLLAQQTYLAHPEVQEQWYAAAMADYPGTVAKLRARVAAGADLWAPL